MSARIRTSSSAAAITLIPGKRGWTSPACWAMALLCVSAQAQEASQALDISSQADRTEITIGDQLHYRITVKFPEGGRIDLPSVLGNLGAFEVKDYKNDAPSRAEGKLKQTWSFTLSTFTVGDYLIPPQTVEYRQGRDTAAQVFMTQPIAVKVKRTSPETVKDIADLAPPEEPAVRRPWWLAAAVALLGLAAFLAWKLTRRHRQVTVAEAPLAPPFEEAMASLLSLNAISLVRQNRGKELAFALSHLLRRYISRRFAIDALESTSSEFVELAAALPLPLAQKPFIPRFCEITDTVKFADAVLLESEAGSLVDDIRRFLEATRPKEEPKTHAAKEGAA